MVKVEAKNKVGEIRKRRGLRQVDLAKMVGAFESEISEIESEKRKINIYLAKELLEP